MKFSTSHLLAAGTLLLAANASLCLAQAPTDTFAAYWYHQGKAEITSYKLEQARYGEVHPGEAVLIFVTEDFSRRRQVKLDDPPSAGDDRVRIMKLNLTKRFDTGVYPYTMMTSVFTPVDISRDPHTLKITTSSQEWCGHTFTQLNRDDDGYRVEARSYFESEGDVNLELQSELTEDGLWNLIRLDPSALPTGDIRIVPGTLFQRLRHTPFEVQQAAATLEDDPEDGSLWRYSLHYPRLGRTLSLRFAKAFPHEIESWEEVYASGWGPGAKPLTTRAVRHKRLMLDYWRHHDLADAPLRKELGLER